MAEQSKESLEQRINQLRNERQQFKKSIVTLLHSVPVAISLKRIQDSTFIFCNKAFSDLFQFTVDEIIGRKETDIFPAQEKLETRSRSVSSDKKLQTFKGTTRVVQSFRMPMKKGGSEKYLFTFYIDKTNDIEALDQFEAFEKILLKAEHVAHIGHWEYDVIENKAKISPECSRIFGSSWSSTPRTWKDFTERVHPEDKNRVIQTFTNALKKGTVFDACYRIQTPDNIIKHVQARGYFERNAQGKVHRSIGMISDITPLKRREQKLQRYATQLENAQTIARLGHWLHDVANNRFLVSPEVKKLLSLRTSEFTLEMLLRVIHPEDRPIVVKSLREKDDREIEIKVRIVIHQKTKWLRLIGRNLFSTDGSLIQAFGTVQEITKQKTRELALQARENYFHRLFAHSYYATLVLSPKPQEENRGFLCRDINAAFTEYFGIAKDDAVDRPLSALFPGAFQKWRPHLNAVLVEQKSRHFEMYWPSSQKYFQVIAYPTESNQLAVIFNDITLRKYHEEELRISELRFRLLFENSADIMWMLNMDLEPILISPSAERVRGFSIETIYKQSLEEKMTPSSYKRLKEKGQPYFEHIKKLKKNAPQQHLEIELDFYHKDGGIIPSQVRVSPVYSDNGEPIALIGVTRDISERRQAEQESRTHAARLHESRRLAKLGSWDYDPRKKRVFLSEEMSAMTEYSPEEISGVYDLLDFYRKLVYPNDLKATLKIVRQSLEQRQNWETHYRLYAQNKKIRYVREIGQLELDSKGRIKQIHATIQNITDIKNIEQKALEKENHLQSLLEALPGFMFVFDRHGVVVDIDVPHHLSTQKPEEWLNRQISEILPLQSARTIIEHISKALQQRKKQIFEIWLPIRKQWHKFDVHLSPCAPGEVLAILRTRQNNSLNSLNDDNTDATVAHNESFDWHNAQQPNLTDKAIPGGNETILLADDEKHICEVSRTFLEQAGYRVYVANTGEEAIDLFFHHMHEIQLLVLDVVMPDKSGKQVYDKVSTFKPDIPVLFCSAYTRHLLREDHEIYISRQLLRKPYDREELLLKVRDVLDQEQYQAH